MPRRPAATGLAATGLAATWETGRDRSRPPLSDTARNVAECYLPEDKQMILGVIETGIGSVDAFNQLVRKAFAFKDEKKRFSMRSPTQAIVIGMERGASAGVASGRRSSKDSGRRPSSRPSV